MTEVRVPWQGLNHLALITNDMDATVRFWHGVIGAPLVATIGTETFRHYFFSFGPTSSVAFFEYIGQHSEMVAKPAGVFDERAGLAIESPDRFDEERSRLFGAGGDLGVDELTLAAVRALPSGDRHAAWLRGRDALERAATGLADDTRVPWYGPSMGAKSFLTARLMECWAHGQDVVDAVHAHRPASDRLRHVVQMGYATRGWTYANRGEAAPEGDVHLRLTAPSGEEWKNRKVGHVPGSEKIIATA